MVYKQIFQLREGSMHIDSTNDCTKKPNKRDTLNQCCNPFKPEFTIVIIIHYKPRIAVAILDL